MGSRAKQPVLARAYHAPRRAAAAAETRRTILRAAKEEFETRGWAATTIRSIGLRAGVSPKTVEALFATKPALLEATVLAALPRDAPHTDGGDLAVLRPDAVLELRGEGARAVEAAPDAATMLERHAALVFEVNARAARLFWVVETAVASDERIAEIGARLTAALHHGVRWSAETLLGKPGVRADLTLREAEETFLVAMDWSTYHTLTTRGALGPEEVQAWATRYSRRMLLA
jgi:AcrR family transcriptional regulator